MPPVEPEALRAASRAFRPAVTVVTAIGPAGPAGATANAVASLSLEPPMMLACLDLGSRTLVAVEHARRFGINVLAAGQAELARRFSTKDPHPEKWEGVAWEERAGTPRMEGALIWLACELRDVHDGGDHVDRHRRGARARGLRGRAAPLLPWRVPPAGRRRRSLTAVVAARSASRKMTSAETAMIPVSRRTIASAVSRWRSRQRLEVEADQLALGGSGRAASASSETPIGRTP